MRDGTETTGQPRSFDDFLRDTDGEGTVNDFTRELIEWRKRNRIGQENAGEPLGATAMALLIEEKGEQS